MLWYKALHLIFMVCWFAGIFYLPRLFVYHAAADVDEVSHARFCLMERRLYRGIMTPSAILTVICGLGMFYSVGPTVYLAQGWMHAKLSLIVLLIAYHFYCGVCMRRFARDANRHSSRFYRFFNEVPVICLVGIVILAVIKPF